MSNRVDQCFGNLMTCKGKPVYRAVILDGPASCYNDSVWCETCMGESFREGNPYLVKKEARDEHR